MPRRGRGGVRDKWRRKKWYTVLAPPLFNSIPIGETPADEDWKLLGRVIETTLFDLTGDFTKHYVHIRFQIYKVEDNTAYTRFKGHELGRDYMKSIIRRKSSKIASIVNVWTRDGYMLRVTGVALTTFRCKTSQRRAIRKIMTEILLNRAKEMTLDEYISAMLFGKLANEIAEEAKKIYPIRKVEIYKSKLLYMPGPNGQPVKAVIVAQKPA